jgi:hypothetical protein
MTAVVKGAEQLEALGRRLKAAGGAELRKELLRGIRNSNKGTIKRIRASAAASSLTVAGSPALVAASKIGTRTASLARGRGDDHRHREVGPWACALNEGKLRHPVFARAENRKHWAWVSRTVRPHWFDQAGRGRPAADPIVHPEGHG